MLANKNYVPILKSKEGELKALELLDNNLKKLITPLFVIKPLSDDTFEESIEKFYSKLKRYWPLGLSIFIDFDLVSQDITKEQLSIFFTKTVDDGVNIIPVLNLNSSKSMLDAISQFLRKNSSELCLRIDPKDMDITLEQNIDELLTKLDVPHQKTHLILDLKEISEDQINPMSLSIRGLLASIEQVDNWKSIILASSSFPPFIPKLNNSPISLPRVDWLLWNKLYHTKNKQRKLIFADYGIDNPYYTALSPFARAKPNLRYTTGDNWLIFQSKNINEGNQPFKELCNSLITSPEYRGREFSWGDNDIYEKAIKPSCGPGNSTTWRQIGFNQHITYVLHQLSSLP